MEKAFVIMQIGNRELDKVYNEVFVPAIKESNLEPRRIDKHNKGGLLKSEIISFIEESEIIIADLTNERPNCYLEIGYSMGIGKFHNLILTSREDHNPDSSNYKKGGPKVHFDLTGYDILFWNQDDLNKFKEDLTKRISRRLFIRKSQEETKGASWDEEWIKENQERAFYKFKKTGLKGYMEVRYKLVDYEISLIQKDLLIAMENSQIHTFGWPIGIVFSKPEYKPRPIPNGIFAEIILKDRPMMSGNRTSYDYWSLRKNGDFYLLKSIFEDYTEKGKENAVFFNTRIVRITEVLIHCARLYMNLGVNSDSEVLVGIKLGGLQGRYLDSAGSGRHLSSHPECSVDEYETKEKFKLSQIESDLVNIVKKYTAPLFALFDFYEVNDLVYEDIINNYIEGKTT